MCRCRTHTFDGHPPDSVEFVRLLRGVMLALTRAIRCAVGDGQSGVLAASSRAVSGLCPSAAFRALPDYRAYASVAAQLELQIIDELSTVLLSDAKRSAFYPAGAVTALVLDRARPSWRTEYFPAPFMLSPLLR